MGLIALVAFWGMNVKLWVGTGDLRLPLIFAAIWGVSLLAMGMLGVGQFFVVVEAILVIVVFFTERSKTV